MRVCLLSTYLPQRCGIATYTAQLAKALTECHDTQVSVVAELGAEKGNNNGIDVWPTFNRTQNYVPSLVDKVAELDSELVHVQHSPDIWGMDDRLAELLDALSQKNIATVVTLHTVHTARSAALEGRFGVARFHRRIAQLADAIIVHGGPNMAVELRRQGVPADKIREIAHGTPRIETLDRNEARLQLGLPPDAFVLLCFGFIHLQKNLHTVVLAMKRVHERVPNALLYIVGSLQNRAWYNRGYLQVLRSLGARTGSPTGVMVREDFVSQAEWPSLYGAADIVMLPYAQGYGSSSGIAHLAVGARRIPLCSRSPKFIEIGQYIDSELLVPTHSPRAWADALIRLLTDDARRAQLAAKVERFAEGTSWPVIARQHCDLYRTLVGTP